MTSSDGGDLKKRKSSDASEEDQTDLKNMLGRKSKKDKKDPNALPPVPATQMVSPTDSS